MDQSNATARGAFSIGDAQNQHSRQSEEDAYASQLAPAICCAGSSRPGEPCSLRLLGEWNSLHSPPDGYGTVMVSGPKVVDRPPESMATTVTACVPGEIVAAG